LDAALRHINRTYSLNLTRILLLRDDVFYTISLSNIGMTYSGYEGIALYPNVAKNNTLAAPKDGVQFVIPPPMPIAGKEIVPHPRKYKTELCRQWEASGKCSHGGKCTFVHDKNKRYHK